MVGGAGVRGCRPRAPVPPKNVSPKKNTKNTNTTMKLKNRMIEIALRILIAALTAALTAITTTSCMGFGPVTL